MAMKIITMSVRDFIALPDNPRQRDTVRHAAKAVKSHLKYPSDTQYVVAVACINGVPVCKLDGHTRAYLWESGDLELVADNVTVQAYEVLSMAEACELYTHFDSSSAVEGSVDKLSGACRQSGLILKSNLLSDYQFNTALKVAHALGAMGGADEYRIVPIWSPAIAEVDSWGLPKSKFKGSGLVSLMFIIAGSTEIDSSIAKEFFWKYQRGEGVKNGTKRDGVQALEEHMADRRARKLMTGYDNIVDMIFKGYSCLSAWSKNQLLINVQPSREKVVDLHAKTRHYLESKLNQKARG
jgi:hypothetical protein